jgi:hypothetical protein
MPLSEREIEVGGVYQGSGACFGREVDAIFPIDGRLRVHWFTVATMAAEWADGRRFHTPNRSCWLSTFARWAERRL